VEIAVALHSSYQLTFADVLPIMRAVGCAATDNCEYPPPSPNDIKVPTANLLWFAQTAFEPLPPLAGHRDNFDTSLLNFLTIDVFEAGPGSNRTWVAQFTNNLGRGPESLSLKPNFYSFTWKPAKDQEGHNFEIRHSVAGLDLGFNPFTPKTPASVPFKFRIDNHPVIRARVLHRQNRPASSIGTALHDEFAVTAEDLVRILYEEQFNPGEIGTALATTYSATPVQAASATRLAGLPGSFALRMIESAFGQTNVTNGVVTLRLALFPIAEVWRALETVHGLKDKDIEGILIAGGFSEEAVLAVLAPRLLAKYACIIDRAGPVVYLHPDEVLMASSVDWFMERATLAWTNNNGLGQRKVTSTNLTATTQEVETRDGPTKFWLELPESERRGDFSTAKAYVHAVRLKDMGMTDLQFWMFRAYNGPGTVKATASIDPIGGVCSGEAEAGNVHPLGEHTGDWEAVYLRFDDASGELVKVFTSQHGAAPVSQTNRITFEGRHPVFYASLNGHANYIEQGDNQDVAFSACESPFYVSVSTLNRTGKGPLFPVYQKYDFAALDNALLDAPWMVFPGTWGPGNPFNLTDDRKEEILRAVAGNCTDAIRVAIPVACAVACAPAAALFGVGYLPCLAGCTAAGEIALDPILERYAPMVVDFAFPDQTSGTPTSPGSKKSEWAYFRYPGEQLFKIDVVEPHHALDEWIGIEEQPENRPRPFPNLLNDRPLGLEQGVRAEHDPRSVRGPGFLELLEQIGPDHFGIQELLELDGRQLANLLLGVVHAALLADACADLFHHLFDVDGVGSYVEVRHTE